LGLFRQQSIGEPSLARIGCPIAAVAAQPANNASEFLPTNKTIYHSRKFDWDYKSKEVFGVD